MYLKSLHLIGFKTFADETTIEFDPGFTAVVGPNGSGKSNILDAIKWVFGEKSAKGLRGEKMDDVIFHGSESRKPCGFAEVSIIFDNSNQFFSIDYPILKITRRLYPDGENEYYINDTRVPRKEIEKITMDTGIGKSSYSILEQGRVDQILNSKPEERRAIFEEAAGISRFKVERKEALKKLEDTQKNLQRIDDILFSMKREMEIKEKQSEKAEIYFRLKNEMAEADKNIRYLKLNDFRKKLEKFEEELENIRKQNSNLLQKISEETKNIQALEEKKIEVERQSLQIDNELRDYFSKTQIQKEKIAKNKEIIQEYNSRILEYAQLESNELSHLDKIELELEDLNQKIIIIIQDNQSLENLHKEKTEFKNNLQSQIELEQKIILERNEKIKFYEVELNQLKEKTKQVIYDLVQLLEARKKDAENKEKERLDLRAELLGYLEQYADAIDNLKEFISKNDLSQVYYILNQIDFRKFYNRFQMYMDIDDHFRNMFLDKGGVLARKEELDNQMEKILMLKENLIKENEKSNLRIEELRNQIQMIIEEIVLIEKKILENKSKLENFQENIKSLQERKIEIELNIQKLVDSKLIIQSKKKELELEIEKLENELEENYNTFLNMSKTLDSTKETLRNLQYSIQQLKENISKNQEEYQSLFPILTDKEKNISALKVQIETLAEELYNEYSITEKELMDERANLILNKAEEEIRLRNAKFEIQQLGSINPLAIEEYKNTKEIYEHHLAQKRDIESSKRDIEEVLDKINLESERLFLDTFEKIRENFQETFQTLFGGGRATLELTEKIDSLQAGIEIYAEPPGKHVQNLRLLSGGEKSLTAIALLFAIYMVKPSPFCFLDEIDAALDEVNKLRFCTLLDKFKDKSQFIVISHAQSTITRANTIFGVTNEEPGVSKIVSLRLDEAKSFYERAPKVAVS